MRIRLEFEPAEYRAWLVKEATAAQAALDEALQHPEMWIRAGHPPVVVHSTRAAHLERFIEGQLDWADRVTVTATADISITVRENADVVDWSLTVGALLPAWAVAIVTPKYNASQRFTPQELLADFDTRMAQQEQEA